MGPGPGSVVIPRLPVADWEARFGVVAGITTRGEPGRPSDFDLRRFATSPEVRGRWEELRRDLGFRGLAVARQVHGRAVLWHRDLAGVKIFDGADGHATRQSGVLLAVTVADCVPIYLVDPVARAVALLHSGWRGSAANILAEGIVALERGAGSRVENIAMHCGVGICGECYEVGEEVFSACGVEAPEAGSGCLDLRSVIRQQAGSLGLTEISTSPRCSAHERDLFFSHRASNGRDGRMVAYLGLLPA